MSDVYDCTFRTILNDCRQMILPLINEVFGEHYTGEEIVTFFPNEHFISGQEGEDKERIVDTNFSVIGKTEKKYHWECQSSADSKMLIRLFEYDAQIALDQGQSGSETLTVEFPNSAVLYLRSTGNTPNRYKYIIKTPGGSIEYDIPILKIKIFSSEEIFNRKLYMLIPFYIFNFESEFEEYESNKSKLEQLEAEFKKIIDRLATLEKDGTIGGYDKHVLIRLTDNVVKQIAARYTKILQGVSEVMSGPLIEIEGRKYKEEGLKEGLKEGKFKSLIESVKNLVKNTGWSVDQALNTLAVSPEDRAQILPMLQ